MEKEPYTLTCTHQQVAIVGQQRTRLQLGVVHELSESGWAATDLSSARSHQGSHFYGHILWPLHVVVLRVPPSRATVRSHKAISTPS